MGEAKKIDIPALAALCRKWLPAFKAAEHLCNIGIAVVLSRSAEYTSLANIVSESLYQPSGTYRIISLAVRAGLVDKNPSGGRGPLYRATPLMKSVLNAEIRAEALYILATHGEILNALGEGDKNQSALCEYTDTQQTTMSLQMKRLITAGWVDRRQEGKEVWYSLSEMARRVMPVVAAELRGLE
jgi:DNA-binding transcriptional ArsR family regulator